MKQHYGLDLIQNNQVEKGDLICAQIRKDWSWIDDY